MIVDKVLIGIGTLILGLVIGIQISFMASDHPSNLEKSGYETLIAPGRYIKSTDFNNHSYIHLRNSWNSAGDQLLHDHNCQCYKNKEKS